MKRATLPPVCGVDRCNRSPWARNMCFMHYQQWKRANPDQIPVMTEKRILAALPGTRVEIEARTGLEEQTVKRHMQVLREDDKAHVQHRIPVYENGITIWRNVYAAGPGVDATVEANVILEQRRARKRQRYHERLALRARVASHPGQLWADPFNLNQLRKEA